MKQEQEHFTDDNGQCYLGCLACAEQHLKQKASQQDFLSRMHELLLPYAAIKEQLAIANKQHGRLHMEEDQSEWFWTLGLIDGFMIVLGLMPKLVDLPEDKQLDPLTVNRNIQVTLPKHRPHIVDGEFQSDKYPTTPRGKVPLSVKDPTAQDLLWEYAQRRRSVDAEFADDLEFALEAAGFDSGSASGIGARLAKAENRVQDLELCDSCGVPAVRHVCRTHCHD